MLQQPAQMIEALLPLNWANIATSTKMMADSSWLGPG